MAITETLQGLGEWGFSLSNSAPKTVLDQLKYFGHIAVTAGKDDHPAIAGDALLREARYVGVYQGKANAADAYGMKGVGMAFWLGDADKKGYVYETPLAVNDTFHNVVPLLLPPSVHAGTIYSPAKSFQFTFQYVSPREAMDYMCDTLDCAWRVNGDATLDAGDVSDLFVTIPRAALVRKGSSAEGEDLFLKAFGGSLKTDQDVMDFTTRTVLLASGSEGSTVTATADINPALNTFKDRWGNAVVLTRLVSESDTDATNAPARAQLQQNRFSGTRDSIALSTSRYDLKGDVAVGDYLWVEDADIGLYDFLNEIYFRGDKLYPMKLRLTEMTYPITAQMGVYFRDGNGTWIDLTPWVLFETGDTTLVVGGYNRSLTGDGGTVGSRPTVDTSIPDNPTWVTPFAYSIYQNDTGQTRAQVELSWLRPNNIDGTPILDLSHYEIRYRTSSIPLFPITHAAMAVYTHNQLAVAGTYDHPITYVPGAYQYATVPADVLRFLLIDLPTTMPYEVEIRAVDAAKPPNAGDWSPLEVFQTSGDTIPPSTPAPPSVAASTLAVQVRHDLGQSGGGTFNLELDLHHLEVHGGATAGFTPTTSTLIGRLPANAGMIIGSIPAVATFNLDSATPVYFKVIAVDNDGNASPASTGVAATAILVDSAHISDLTASKITAGTITAAILMAGRIATALSGQRVEINANGVEQYNASNVLQSYIRGADALFVGQVQSGASSNRVIINQASGGSYIPEIRFFPTSGTAYSYINAPSAGAPTLGMNSGSTGGTRQTTLWLFENTALLGYSEVGTGNFKGGRIALDANSANVEKLDSTGGRNGGFTWNRDTDWWAGISLPGGSDAFLRITTNTEITLKGYFQKNANEGGASALYVGRAVASGGSVSVGYGATMQSNMTVIAQWTDYTGWVSTTVLNVYSDTFTGFTMGNGTGSRNGHYGYWVFRHL